MIKNIVRITLQNIRILIATLLFLGVGTAYGQQYTVTAPGGQLQVGVNVAEDIQYTVIYDDFMVITASTISMTLGNGQVLGQNAIVESTSTHTANDVIKPLHGKTNELQENYEELTFDFEGNYSLIFRAYEEGIAYRFKTSFEEDVIVKSEEANFNFSATTSVIFPEADALMRSWERAYTNYSSIAEIPASKFSITPTMFTYDEAGIRVVVAESDLFDYPGMYLDQNDEGGMKGKWAHYPKEVSDPDDVYAYHRVISREDFIAKTNGTRTYPWRVVIVEDDDKQLLTNQLIYKLATPSVLTDTGWIEPGKSAWEWWHDAILETNAIPSGNSNLSYNLYKYYVDFAADYGLEYVTMDAGWSMDFAPQIIQYAAKKGVKIILWDFINLPIVNPARLDQLKNMGAAGIKVDLIERDDQVAINWLEQLAKDCAERELVIIYHGCPKPTGLERTYPNIVNFEAVRGAETTKWDALANPDYHLQVPFIRMLAGPLDYTPGSMRNVHPEEFEPIPQGIPMTMGTRVHELAMYVLFDQPLGYLCDSPIEYRKHPNIMKYLGHVPTTWDQTVPLAAEVGEYAVIAKQSGEEWYVAAMTNNEAREVEIDFSFLQNDSERSVMVYTDNAQTENDAKAYDYEYTTVTGQDKKTFQLARGGGLVIRILGGMVTGVGPAEREEQPWIFLSQNETWLNVRTHHSLKSISIVGLSGKVFYEQKENGQKTSSELDISNLKNGLYIVRVQSATGYQSIKFVKSSNVK